jgi:hypothetical protein
VFFPAKKEKRTHALTSAGENVSVSLYESHRSPGQSGARVDYEKLRTDWKGTYARWMARSLKSTAAEQLGTINSM